MKRLATVWLLASMILAGCAGSAPGASGAAQPPGLPPPQQVTEAEPAAQPPQAEPPKPQPPAWVTPVTAENFAGLVAQHRPNELGRVLILEYHHFGEVEERWTRTYDNFRHDLEVLHAKGFRAVSLLDYINGTMALPAGTSPVVLTFDDSPRNQFPALMKEGELAPDPKSPVAIMLQFAREHPDFGLAATFYVKFTEVPFEEPETWKEKLRFLVDQGFEVANHSYTHDDLSAMNDEGVRRSLAMNVRRVREVLPGYDGSTLALPFGLMPANGALAREGEWEGTRYQHRAVLYAADSPNFSPYDRRRDLFALQRTQAIQPEFDRWFTYLETYRYVSDGDPDTVVIPQSYREYLHEETVRGKQLLTYPDADDT